jgi:hypothetical protein
MTSTKVVERFVALLVAAVAVGFAPAGCVTPASTTCADGLICPPDSRCDDVNHRCLGATYCGDGERTGSEVCEGDDLGGETCKSLGFYGQTTGLTCSADCKFDKSGCSGRCGDGLINGPDEQCDGAPPAGKSCLDYGYDAGFLGCSELCQLSVSGCEKLGWVPAQTGQDATGDNGSAGVGAIAASGYNAIWGSSADDLFAVGPGVVHWDGTAWTTMDAPAPGTPGASGSSDDSPPTPPPGGVPFPQPGAGWTGVWGSGPKDLWVVGGHKLAHWDGSNWSTWWLTFFGEMPTFFRGASGTEADAGPADPTPWTFLGVWGTGPSDVYAFGGMVAAQGACIVTNGVCAAPPVGQLFHWDGAQWSEAQLPVAADDWVQAIGGSSPDDVYVLTKGGAHLHGDGANWTPVKIGTADNPQSIWASAADDVYAVGPTETVHWNGSSWAAVAGAPRNGSFVWGNGPSNVYIRSDVVDPNNVYIGSDVVWHWNGATWSPIYQPGNSGFPVRGVWGAGSLESTWVLGADGILGVSRGLLVPEAEAGGALWGTGEDVFAIADTGDPDTGMPGTSTFRHLRKGAAPATLPPPPLTGVSLWGSAVDDIWASGWDAPGDPSQGLPPFGSNVARWDGFEWAALKTPRSGTGGPPRLFGSSASDVWAISATGDSAMHWDGQAWSEPYALEGGCLSAWSRSLTEAYCLGGPSAISRWDGTSWSSMPSGTDQLLTDVWGTDRDVFVVGMNGTILRLEDGERWTAMPSGMWNYPAQIRGSGAGNLFVADVNRLFHLRGGAWEPMTSVHGGNLWVTPTSVYISGQRLDLVGVNCESPETNCTDGWDNDCDGLQDGADPDCAGKAAAEQCANLADDDYDGLTDCADPDCATFSRCRQP